MKRRVIGASLVLLAVLALVGLTMAGTNLGIVNGTADLVLGQPTFDDDTATASTTSLSNPYDCVLDSEGNLWVADEGNNRVLMFDLNSDDTEADLVIGNTNYTDSTPGLSDTMLSGPCAVAFDLSGNLYVQDGGNNRILRFDADTTTGLVTDTTADFVIGQEAFDTNVVGTSDTYIDIDDGQIAFDDSGNLYIAEYNNNRILRFDSGDTAIDEATADFVIGQGGLFDTNVAGASDTAISGPQGLGFDSEGNLYVAFYDNNRVLRYNVGDTVTITDDTADFVIGQADFTSNAAGLSDTMLSEPYGVKIDPFGNLWVVDADNNRILRFDVNSSTGLISDTEADLVLGQEDFITGDSGTSSTTLYYPTYMTFDSAGRLYVADGDNNRVLFFNTSYLADDDDNCFIATAAYGKASDALASFHQFRDGVLMQSRLGRGFVEAYYQFGPKAASMLTTDSSKFAARALLTPVLGFAKLANLLGMMGAVALLSLTVGGLFILSKKIS